ncbi:MAG TPA: type II 3-dehydroquinate dehydratase [Rhizomicrobium sp.]|jgi:3-dehydroquinate dehydratase-2|nr:type II 3-dehydroquinate dehydratase [Rhizomicrobium sp.]
MAKNTSKSKTLPIYIINGPNLNLLGTREPEIYGRTTLGEVETLCAARAKSHGLSTVFLQSNKEGELVEFLQEARSMASGVILNAAGYTHTSVAILDALQMLKPPVIEVHLSNPARREEYRHLSYVAKAATGSITGLGVNSYLLAIDAVAAILAGPKGSKK